MTIHPKSIVASYFVFQAISVAAWWLMLWSIPAAAAWFQPSSWPRECLLSFAIADWLGLIGGSSIAAAAVLKGNRHASTVVWSVTMLSWYPALYCLGTSVLTDEAWLASAMMVSMAGLSLAMATIWGTAEQSPATIRELPMNQLHASLWTLVQTIIFWSLFLWILPKAIVELEQRLGWPAFHHAWQEPCSIALFLIASALGLSSGLSMAIRGQGTPLPTATAPFLVIEGPYRWVRNPMALAGIAQGVAVGWNLGSYSVIAYALLGAFVWHLFVRPVEEADLKHRFGKAYLHYKSRVRLWLPKSAPYVKAG